MTNIPRGLRAAVMAFEPGKPYKVVTVPQGHFGLGDYFALLDLAVPLRAGEYHTALAEALHNTPVICLPYAAMVSAKAQDVDEMTAMAKAVLVMGQYKTEAPASSAIYLYLEDPLQETGSTQPEPWPLGDILGGQVVH